MTGEIKMKKIEHKWYWLGLVSSMVIFAGSAWLAHKNLGYLRWERQILETINNWPDSLRPLFLVLTVAPESIWIGLAGVLVTFLLRMYHITLRLAFGVLGAAGAVYLVKHFIDRARPGGVLAAAHIRVAETGAGFPSGHTAIMTVVVLTLAVYLPKRLRWLAILPIIAMGLSRIYLGVHAPLDIVGGFAIGLGAVCFINVLPVWLKNKLRIY
jgi:membrane-associated phospholipid phosphatase